MIIEEDVSCHKYTCDVCGYDWIARHKMNSPKCPICSYHNKIEELEPAENLKDKFMEHKEIRASAEKLHILL